MKRVVGREKNTAKFTSEHLGTILLYQTEGNAKAI